MPKSGDDDDQMAPMDAAASMPITVSGRLGMKAATRSPFLTPSRFNPSAILCVSSYNSLKVNCLEIPVSPRKIMAGWSSRRCSRFPA